MTTTRRSTSGAGPTSSNIVTFDQRYDDVAQFRLLTNRRSRPGIVAAGQLVRPDDPRAAAEGDGTHREAVGSSVAIGLDFEDEAAEAEALAQTISVLAEEGVPYRDMAVLVRGKVAYGDPRRVRGHGVPVQPGGRTGLFLQPEAEVLGATFAWLADVDWAPSGSRAAKRWSWRTSSPGIRRSSRSRSARRRSARHLTAWKAKTPNEDFSVNLVGELYELLGLLDLASWDTRTPGPATGSAPSPGSARSWRTTRPSPDALVGTPRTPGSRSPARSAASGSTGTSRILLANYANGSYDDFDGEQDLVADGVALGTVHGAKGLEWPIVFLPSLTARQIPLRAGRASRLVASPGTV